MQSPDAVPKKTHQAAPAPASPPKTPPRPAAPSERFPSPPPLERKKRPLSTTGDAYMGDFPVIDFNE